ncbi:hypothetical protein DNTS_025239 [Danionella cerebrum]|uniref:Uncharacterized protein n=1 Tax=Danionella cerebrum TaxID=2873325 RepID=A0A553QXA2_9TELE|nr:hypothetical protein DNTS_025239 [Danionella translucida]
MAQKYTVEDVLTVIMDGNSSDMEQLGEDDDDDEEEEEWTPTTNIGENPDSSDDEEEENPDSSDDDENPEVPQEDTTKPKNTTLKQSAKGKVKKKVYRWKRKQFEPPSVEFVECVEEDSEERLDWTPYILFVSRIQLGKRDCPLFLSFPMLHPHCVEVSLGTSDKKALGMTPLLPLPPSSEQQISQLIHVTQKISISIYFYSTWNEGRLHQGIVRLLEHEITEQRPHSTPRAENYTTAQKRAGNESMLLQQARKKSRIDSERDEGRWYAPPQVSFLKGLISDSHGGLSNQMRESFSASPSLVVLQRLGGCSDINDRWADSGMSMKKWIRLIMASSKVFNEMNGHFSAQLKQTLAKVE